MLEIVLLILKIAGVIFVSVLGILIVLTGIVLFVPVRYRGDFLVSDQADSGKKAIAVRLKAAWFFRFIRVYLTWEGALRIRFKLLFFTIRDTAKEESEKRKKRDRRKKNKSAGNGGAGEKEQGAESSGTDGKKQDAGLTEETAAEEIASGEAGAEETAVKEIVFEETVSEKNASGEKGEREETPDDGENAADTGEKKDKPDEKKTIKSGISNMMETIRNFCDKLKEIKKKKDKIGALWGSKHMGNSRNLLGKQLRYLLRHTKPKNLSGYLRFGFDDPSHTGYAMAVYGILYPVWSPKLSVEPDFEKQVLDCHVLIKGKIRVWHFVRVALRMILSRDVRRVIKDVKEF